MFIKKVIVHVDKNFKFENRHQVKISRSLLKHFGFKNGDIVKFQFGSHIEEVDIIEAPAFKVPTIEITPTLAENIAIPFEIFPIHCLYNPDENTLKLGPIITCITNQMYHEDLKFGSMTTFFEELARLAKRYHILFYVKPLIKWEGQLDGYSFHHEQWQNYLFPKPDAVYNRIGSRSFETSNAYQKFAQFLQESNVNYFNHCFLDKWEIHDALSSFPEVTPYLPDTIIFDDYETFAEKLTLYDCIFIKPVHGSQGMQILKIEKSDTDYTVYYSTFSQKISTTFKSSYFLYKRLKDRFNKKNFIIQQGIDLICFEEDRPLDFRVLCIKNDENKWKVISSVARISPKERLVSNIAQGGEQRKPLEVLTTVFDEKLAKQYVRLMGELAVEVASLITESHEGMFAELGIDIALDKEGKLWIIEVNSKPSKIETDKPSDQIRPSSRAILAYLAFLSGFPLQRNEKWKKER